MAAIATSVVSFSVLWWYRIGSLSALVKSLYTYVTRVAVYLLFLDSSPSARLLFLVCHLSHPASTRSSFTTKSLILK